MVLKKVKSLTVDPFGHFIKQESSSSIIMLIAMASAMMIANSPYAAWYHGLWETKIGFTFGSFALYKDSLHWINDGLMALFFLVIGLEIKREILIGELSEFRKALLPLIAAVGGAVVPALIYTAVNVKGGDMNGWGVPMATDIAFAIGIMALLGSRVPIQLKIFITSLAVVDDMIAVLVIALFYSKGIAFAYLAYAGVALVALALMNYSGVRSILAYLAVGMLLWYFFLKSGIHATIAGVLLALFIPSQPKIQLQVFLRSMTHFLKQLGDCKNNPDTEIPTKCQKETLNKVMYTSQAVYNPMSRLEYNLHGLSAYFIMPLFAFANTGVTIDSGSFGGIVTPMGLGIIFGLLIGKPLGIFSFVKIAEKMNLVTLPKQLTNASLTGVAVLSGIGLTMSIFIASMAFSPAAVNSAKIAILTASVLAGIGGYILLSRIRTE
ncbi:MAG: Na+/H+ antiporter NhaA [Deferribacterales bacterium]